VNPESVTRNVLAQESPRRRVGRNGLHPADGGGYQTPSGNVWVRKDLSGGLRTWWLAIDRRQDNLVVAEDKSFAWVASRALELDSEDEA